MKQSRKKSLLRIIIVVLIVVVLMTVGYFVLRWTGWWEKLNSVSKLQETILELGFWGRFAFVFLQFLQVTLLPIPSPILIAAGSLIYGSFEAGLLSLSGILLGSAFAFFLGKMFGVKIVEFMVGKENSIKWQKFLSRCKYTFVVMMLLPCFPDDVLCLVAGLTDMGWTFFMVTQLTTRPIGVFLVSYFSGGDIIPYHGWGLIVWAIIITASLCLIYLSSKYSEKIENYLKKMFKKKC